MPTTSSGVTVGDKTSDAPVATTAQPLVPHAKASRTTSWTHPGPATTPTAITFTTETSDNDAMFTATDDEIFASMNGIYLAQANLLFAESPTKTDWIMAEFEKVGAAGTYIGAHKVGPLDTTLDTHGLGIAAILKLNTGDSLRVLISGQGTSSGVPTVNSGEFSLTWMGPQS